MDPEALNYDPDAEREDGSCEYEGEEGSAPDNYEFSDAELSQGRVRIELLDRLVRELEKGENGASISLQDLYDIHRNEGLVGNGKTDLEGVLGLQDSLRFDGLLQEAASRSGDPSSIVDGRFITSDSIDFVMLIRFGLMQSAFFQHACKQLLEGLDQLEHAQPDASSATQRERAYDEAFSLFGAPVDYSRSTPLGTTPDHDQGAWFWGEACLRTDSALGHLPGLFNAFVKGRWALTQEREDEREEAIQKVERDWERTAAAMMVRHIKQCMAAIDAMMLGDRIRHWSVVHALLLDLNSNPDGIIGNSEQQGIRDRIGNSPNKTSSQDLNEALILLQDIYGFSNEEIQAL